MGASVRAVLCILHVAVIACSGAAAGARSRRLAAVADARLPAARRCCTRAGPAAEGRKLLRERNWGDTGDPTGTKVLSQARFFEGRGSRVRKALTPEQAESATANDWKGFYRFQAANTSSVAFSTVESDPVTLNPNRRKETVKTFGRVAIDSPERRTRVDVEGGSVQLPALAMGTAAGSQTFEGASAISASDAIEVNGGRRQRTVAAKSMITSYPRPIRRTGAGASIGITAQTARTVAAAGAADGVIAVAQAHEVASMSQAARSDADNWQSP